MYKDTIKHVFFDLDHTLWDFDRNSLLAYQQIFEEECLSIDIDQFLLVYAPINQKYWKLYRDEKVDSQSLRRGRLQETFAVFSLNLSLRQIDKIADQYIAYLPNNSYLLDGAMELLEYLVSKYQLHIITNGFREVQAAKLKNAKIEHFFETVTDSDSVGVKKPNQRIFEHALRIANATNEESLMIGDNFEADILGANAIGLKTICYNYHKENIPKIFLQVSDLSAIKYYL